MPSPQQSTLASLPKALYNMSKAAKGVVTIVVITSMQTLGLGYGIIALLLSAFLSALTLHFLARVTGATGSSTYFGTIAVILGRKGEIVALLALGYFIFIVGAFVFVGASSNLVRLLKRRI